MSYPLIMNPMKKRYLGAVYRMKDRREQGQKKGESGGKPKGRSKRMDDRGGEWNVAGGGDGVTEAHTKP